jgi:DNA replication protein DnaC
MTDIQRLTDKLTDRRLKGMLQHLDPTLEQAVQHNLNVVTTLNRLADIELEHRWHNAIHLRWRQSALTEKLTSDQFDFHHHKSRKEQQTRILALFNLDCIAAHSDIIFIGNPGTGKTFLAKCLAYAACNANVKVLFTTAIAMINQLIAAEADHSLLKKLHHYATPDLLVCDELGYLSLGQQGSHLFFQVISQRHQRKSTVITTNLPFAEWGKVFDSTTVATAIADRLVHNSEVLILGGSSYRRKLTSHHRQRTTHVKGAGQGSPLVPTPFFCRWASDNKAPVRLPDGLAYFSTDGFG